MKRSLYVIVGTLLGALAALAVQELFRRRAEPATAVPDVPETIAPSPPATPPPPAPRPRPRRAHRLAVAVSGFALLAAGLATAAFATGWHHGGSGQSGDDSGWGGGHRHHRGGDEGTTTTEEPPTSTAEQPTTTTELPGGSWHQNITATVFWVGEPKGNGSSEDNSISAYDDAWEQHYGGYDDYTVTRAAPTYANGLGFTPLQNPFYLDLPYDDVNNSVAFADRCRVVPWAGEYPASDCRNGAFSYMKNQWVELEHTVGSVTYTAYGQIEDAGPYVYDDEAYVFGTAQPASWQANNAGLDVSPAVRDSLHFTGSNLADQQNGDSNRVSWRFVDASEVPSGPWSITVTTSQVYQS